MQHQTAAKFEKWWNEHHSLIGRNQIEDIIFLDSVQMNGRLKNLVLDYLDTCFHGRKLKAHEREFTPDDIDNIVNEIQCFIDNNLLSSEEYSSDEEEFDSGEYYSDGFIVFESEYDDTSSIWMRNQSRSRRYM